MSERQRRRGFVTNELPIVFVIACVLGFIVVSAAGGATAWYWKFLSGVGLAVVGLTCLLVLAGTVEALRKRKQARAKAHVGTRRQQQRRTKQNGK